MHIQNTFVLSHNSHTSVQKSSMESVASRTQTQMDTLLGYINQRGVVAKFTKEWFLSIHFTRHADVKMVERITQLVRAAKIPVQISNDNKAISAPINKRPTSTIEDDGKICTISQNGKEISFPSEKRVRTDRLVAQHGSSEVLWIRKKKQHEADNDNQQNQTSKSIAPQNKFFRTGRIMPKPWKTAVSWWGKEAA